MTDSSDNFRNLENVGEGPSSYTVFETDQVLTSGQLNSVALYLDDQERLTRIALIGAGIACGLWPSLDGDAVHLTHGVGASTEGDVFFLPEETVYEAYKSYESPQPDAMPKALAGAYELVAGTAGDPRAKPLSGFAEAEGSALASRVAVLHMERYLRDPDLCTGTDCDNRGKDFVHAVKLLLVDAKAAAALLAGTPDTPDGAARGLDPVTIARPLPQGALNTEADLAAVYRKACDAIYKPLAAALGALFKRCAWLLQDLARNDPGALWQKRLDTLREQAGDRGIQYYYDFLKDVALTYNAFRDALFGDSAVCCPALDAFPTWLVLGSLDPAQRAAVGRTGFYPSPMVSAHFEQRTHARFLVQKLDALIANYVPPAPGEIRITPSAFEDRSLEERAIPFYYAITERLPLYRFWSHELTQRGMERYNYSYSAAAYGAQGAAAAPLDSAIGPFDFFRVEGHLGMSYGEALERLQAAIARWNLPFRVQGVHLGIDRRIVIDPPLRHPDLHLMRDLVREDVATRLTEATTFGGRFIGQVKTASGTRIDDSDNDNIPVVGTTQTKVELMAGHAQRAIGKLRAAIYEPASGWQDDVANAAQAGGELKDALGSVTKNQFASPLDTIITGHSAGWLGWLDTILGDAKDNAADALLLSNFLARHPGLEHYAGVLRGGTFVLVYDAANVVVADFMLPYTYYEPPQAPKLPPLLPPKRPDIVFEKPIRLVALPDKLRVADTIGSRLGSFKTEIQPLWQKDIGAKTGEFFDVFNKSVGTVSGVLGRAPVTGITAGTFTNSVLEAHAAAIEQQTQNLDRMRTLAMDATLPTEQRATLDAQIKTAEEQLATTVVNATQAVAEAKQEPTAGSDALKLLSVVSSGTTRISDATTLGKVTTGLTDIRNTTALTGLQSAIGKLPGMTVMRTRGAPPRTRGAPRGRRK